MIVIQDVCDDSVGYITSSPQFFGAAMRVYVTVTIPLLLQHEPFEDIVDTENLSAYQHDINATQLFMEYAQASNAAPQQSQLNSFVNTYETNRPQSHPRNARSLQHNQITPNLNTPISSGTKASPSPHAVPANATSPDSIFSKKTKKKQ